MIDNTQEYIACSAIWYDDGIERVHNPRNIKSGIVACGLRHCNCFMILFALYPNGEYKGAIKVTEEQQERATIQGFLTSHNRFVDRAEGYQIALARGQCQSSKVEILMSEDIY